MVLADLQLPALWKFLEKAAFPNDINLLEADELLKPHRGRLLCRNEILGGWQLFFETEQDLTMFVLRYS